MKQLVLSLFPGIGLLDMAFEAEGFCVVRGPDLLWGGDVHDFHPPHGRFDGLIGGPPCQAFSRLRHIVEANGYQTAPNLIPEFERVVREAQPSWFLMENVPAAPLPWVDGYDVKDTLLNNRWCGGEQNRVRRFSFGTPDGLSLRIAGAVLEPAGWEAAVCAGGSGRVTPVAMGPGGQRKATATGMVRSLADDCELQGLPRDFLESSPLTSSGKRRAVGNGVPLPMGRAVAAAVRNALGSAR